jgi:hypothetical protein
VVATDRKGTRNHLLQCNMVVEKRANTTPNAAIMNAATTRDLPPLRSLYILRRSPSSLGRVRHLSGGCIAGATARDLSVSVIAESDPHIHSIQQFRIQLQSGHVSIRGDSS